MRQLFCLFVCIFLFKNGFSQRKNNKEKDEILHLLHQQEIAWNEGNINAFMMTYWHHDSLSFVGSKGVTYGWENVLNNYKKSYTDTVKMGKLHFDIIRLDILDKKNAFIIGKWHLKRSIVDIGGHFTLLLKKFANHWFIVTDHTS